MLLHQSPPHASHRHVGGNDFANVEALGIAPEQRRPRFPAKAASVLTVAHFSIHGIKWPIHKTIANSASAASTFAYSMNLVIYPFPTGSLVL